MARFAYPPTTWSAPLDYGSGEYWAREAYLEELACRRDPLCSYLTGLGQQQQYGPLPWEAPAPRLTIEKLSLGVGLLGGILGVILSIRALTKRS